MGNGKKRLFENITYLLFLQIVNYIFPLITIPYLVRVLGTEKFGILAFAQSLTQYFVVFSDYGFNLSATRELALRKNDPSKTTELYSAVQIIKFSFSILGLLIYLLIVSSIPKLRAEWQTFLATYFMVFGNVLLPVWFFQGMERMKYITIINCISKALSTLAIFIFVTDKEDYIKAAGFTSLGWIIAGTIGTYLIYNNFRIQFRKVSIEALFTHLKNGWHVFYTTLIGNLVNNSSVIILGSFESPSVIGGYSAAEKLIKAILSLFSPFTQALFPLHSRRFNESKTEGLKLVIKSGKYICVGASAISIFCVFSSDFLMKMIFGNELSEYSVVIKYLSLWMFFGVLNNILGVQYFIATGKSGFYSIAFTISGLLTVAISLSLVQAYSFFGVVYGMLGGEFVLFLILFTRAMFDLKDLLTKNQSIKTA